ncbi:MAG: 2-C-methyl-D-erythritol 4-phosphate cytidylyltransferase [Pseudomonadales bacterium]|jgi:2-C-methyl-D-erythritol 4-phosphate cytidylyltransferase|nr:2-C-methyl-D-erythritol 4-phosphate cytidylyltransferase [Pseudomonadales bacterium]
MSAAYPFSEHPRHFLVLPAAGAGRRMQSTLPKQYQTLLGKPLLQHTLERVATHPVFTRTVLALAPDDPHWPAVAAALSSTLLTRLTTVPGGADRAASVRAALRALQTHAHEADWVLVHDAVRPCLGASDLERLLQILHDEPYGGILATPVRETVKAATAQGTIAATVAREGLWLAATPQMFRYGVLCRALDAAHDAGVAVTDEAAAVEYWLTTQSGISGGIRLVPGAASNLKVTYPEDLHLAALLLSSLSRAGEGEGEGERERERESMA